MPKHSPLPRESVSLLERHSFVVIGADHRNPLNIARSLGVCGIRPDAIVIGSDSHLLAACRYIRRVTLVPSHAAALEKLLELYGSQPNKVFVLTGEDKMTECLNENRQQLENFYYFSVTKGPEPLCYFQKPTQNALAQRWGFRIPKSILWRKGDPLPQVDSDVFPVITKAANSLSEHWKESFSICRSQAELEAVLENFHGEELLIQQYIRKQNELAIQGFSTGSSVDFTVCTTYRYLLEGDYSHYVDASACGDSQLNSAIAGMISDMGFHGIFEAEFLVDEQGALWFLEINLRCTALLYLSNHAGLPPAPLWALRTLGQPLPPTAVTLPICGISEFDDLRARVLPKRISPAAWLRELRSCQCRCYNDPGDRKPFYAELKATVLRKLGRIS